MEYPRNNRRPWSAAKGVAFPSLSTVAISSEDRRSLKTAVNRWPSRSIDQDRNGIGEWTRTKRIAGCRTRRVYVEKRGARDQVHNDLAVVERDGTRRWVVKGGGMYTRTHTVCVNRCVGGESTVVEEGDITMHRRTLRRFLYVATLLALSLSTLSLVHPRVFTSYFTLYRNRWPL